MMGVPSTAAYQKHRVITLRGITRARVLETARGLMKANQKSGHRYTRKIKDALRDGIGGTDGCGRNV